MLGEFFWYILVAIAFVGLIWAIRGILVRKKPAEKSTPKSCPKSCLENAKILIVDDLAEIRELIRIILKKNGANITCCANGDEALEKISQKKYDIILLDLNMPDMPGYEIAKKIRLSSLKKGVYMIALTASTLADLANRHIEAGFDDHFEKPVRPESLVRKIKLVLLRNQQIEDACQEHEIISNYTDDPDYKKTIERFINHLPAMVSGIKSDLETGHIDSMSDKVHSLKGLGGMAGFPIISEKAEKIEKTINTGHIDEEIDSLRKQVNELICLCQKTKITK